MSALDAILPEPLVSSSGLVDMPASEYHADPSIVPSLSSSLAKTLLNKTPAHARLEHPKLNPNYVNVEEDKFDVGTSAHELLLEGEAAVAVCDFPDWRTAAAKEARDEARAIGQTPLLTKDWERVEAMANAAKRQLEMFDLEPAPFMDGSAEQALVWDDGDGVWCRARFDWVRDDLTAIDDLKTTAASARPEAWAKTMFGFGGDFQAAFYLRGLRKALGVEPVWRFVVQEAYPPYALSVVTPSEEVLAYAAEKVDRAIRLWRDCLADNHWPAYSREVGVIELPTWMRDRPIPSLASFGDEAPF